MSTTTRRNVKSSVTMIAVGAVLAGLVAVFAEPETLNFLTTKLGTSLGLIVFVFFYRVVAEFQNSIVDRNSKGTVSGYGPREAVKI